MLAESTVDDICRRIDAVIGNGCWSTHSMARQSITNAIAKAQGME